jgi:hypothetical protein
VGEDVEGRAWVTGKWRQVKLIDRNAVVGCSDIRGDTTTDYESFESSSQAFSFASAAYRWDIRFCCVINCLQSKGCAGRRSTGREAYLPCFVHFSISLAFVLENRIPAFRSGKIGVSEFQAKEDSATIERERGAAYRNWQALSAAQSCRVYAPGRGWDPGRDQRRTRTCRLPKPTCLHMLTGGCSSLCGQGRLGTICCARKEVSRTEVLLWRWVSCSYSSF